MDLGTIGRLIFLFGIGIAVLGGVLMLFGQIPGLKNLGRLPGDIHIRSGNFSCFFPVVSMIILSILLSIGLNIVIRLLNR